MKLHLLISNHWLFESNNKRLGHFMPPHSHSPSLLPHPIARQGCPFTFVLQLILLFHDLSHLYMDNLKEMKDEVMVVTNASNGNDPHVVERIEQDGSLKTRPLAKAKPDGDFVKIDRSESILEAFFSNFKRQYDNPSDFRFYHLPAELLAAAKEMTDLFRKPEENAAMLDGYRLAPEQHAQKQDLQQAPAAETAPRQSTKWGMEQVDWQQLASRLNH